MSAKPLYQDADDTDGKTYEGGFLIAEFGNKHTGRDTHDQISDEISDVSDLCQYIAGTEIVLNDNCHRRA